MLDGRKPLLLIIDDEADLVEALQLRFEASGFDVETAADGRAGLERLLRRRPDVILLDLAMPDVDGCEVCRQVRADPKLSGLPIVLMTAAFVGGVERRAKEAGAAAVVSKPFDDRLLVETVKKHLPKKTETTI